MLRPSNWAAAESRKPRSLARNGLRVTDYGPAKYSVGIFRRPKCDLGQAFFTLAGVKPDTARSRNTFRPTYTGRLKKSRYNSKEAGFWYVWNGGRLLEIKCWHDPPKLPSRGELDSNPRIRANYSQSSSPETCPSRRAIGTRASPVKHQTMKPRK